MLTYFIPGNGSWIPPPTDVQYFTPALHRDTQKNVWLFNITNDPDESNDLSDIYPEVVKQLLERLAYYNSTAIPPVYPPSDPRSNPKFHGGVWGPWE